MYTKILTFFKQKLLSYKFWAGVGQILAYGGIIGGLFSLYLSWQHQLYTMQSNQLIGAITQLQELKNHENKAIITARVAILNQHLECPIESRKALIKLHQERNLTLITITTYGSGLNIKDASRVNQILSEITSLIFNIKTNGLCKLNIKHYTKKLHQLGLSYDQIINQEIAHKEYQLEKLQKKFG